MNILDVGCGYGRTLHELHENNYENLTGVDFSQRIKAVSSLETIEK